MHYAAPEHLSGKRIVTSFPNLAKRYFDQFDTPERKTRKAVLHCEYVLHVLVSDLSHS
jgi:ATP phosphoribosyltransferase